MGLRRTTLVLRDVDADVVVDYIPNAAAGGAAAVRPRRRPSLCRRARRRRCRCRNPFRTCSR